MSYIKNPHSDDPFTDPETAAYTSDRARQAIPVQADGYPIGRAAGQPNPIPTKEFGAALREEEARRDGEPYAIDDDLLKENDVMARAYVKMWSHYEAAYNAVQHRNSLEYCTEQFRMLMEAILGRTFPLEAIDELRFPKLVGEAQRERGRLLSAIERNVETLAVQAESVSSQQKLIYELAGRAAKGKAASDALLSLAVKVGVNPIPKTPEECQRAILVALRMTPPEPTGR